jgi:hypothetical protein
LCFRKHFLPPQAKRKKVFYIKRNISSRAQMGLRRYLISSLVTKVMKRIAARGSYGAYKDKICTTF